MYKWFLIGIFLLALILRTFNLSNLPAGFTPDEASFGYDAYSILKTGHDQWGVRYPLSFKSFGDYKLPVYGYMVIPSILVFGLNEFAVRLPNAVFGALSIFFAFGITFELTKNKKTSLLSSLLLALSYWHVSMSRGAFEANLTTFFMSGGVYFFLASKRNRFFMIFSMLLFGINLFTYHSARIVTPLVVLTLMLFYRDQIKGTKNKLSLLIFLFFFILAGISILWGGSGIRAQTSTLLSQDFGSGKIRANLVISGMESFFARLLYNEPLFKLSKLISNYTSYFSFDYLLTSGAREGTYGMVPGVGVTNIVEFGGIIAFILMSLKKIEKKYLVLLVWVVVGVLPAAISVGPGNAANRAAVVMPATEIISAIGLIYLIDINKFKIVKKFMYPFVIACTIVVSSLVLYRYSVEEPLVASDSMIFGMRDVFRSLDDYPKQNIVLSRSLSEAHIFAMFYTEIAPNLAQEATLDWTFENEGLKWVDQQGTYSIGRYTITEPQKSRFEGNTIVVARANEVPKDVKVLKSILTLDKKPLLVIAQQGEKNEK